MRVLGVTEPVIPHLLPVSKDAMVASYPELEKTFHDVSESAYGEEDAFRRTLDNGIEILDVAVNKAKKTSDPVVSGDDAFTLHDTYGFPIELTLEMAADQGVKVDEAKFRELMSEQKSRARADALKKRHNVDLSVYDDFKKTLVQPIDFLGYTDMSARGRVLGIMQEGKGSVPPSAPPRTSRSSSTVRRSTPRPAASSPIRARSCPTMARCSKSTTCRSRSRISSSTSAV